jgi:hypothetical protein
MQQPCKACGYESPETDKFCRQCGGHLAVETEASAATTLNHGRVEPNPPMASVGTGRFPPSVGDVIAADTERYYSPPQYASAPANIERPPTYAPIDPARPSRLKTFSGLMKGMFMFLLITALLVTTGIAVRFSMEADEARRRWNERERSREGREQAGGRAQNAWDQMEEALQLANEAAEKAAGAGATLTISGEKPIDLNKYAYPGAQVESMIDSKGNEALSLLANDDFDDVQKYYDRLLGKPVLQVAVDRWGNQRKKLLYQSPTLPSILVKVEEIDRRRVKITILNSFLRFPRFNEQAQNLR